MVDCRKTKVYQNQGAPGLDLFLAQPSFKFRNPLDIEVSTRRAGSGEYWWIKWTLVALVQFLGCNRTTIVSVNVRPVNTVDDYVGELQRARGQIVLQVTDVLKRRNCTVAIRPQAP